MILTGAARHSRHHEQEGNYNRQSCFSHHLYIVFPARPRRGNATGLAGNQPASPVGAA
jgi:hypothetical protein